MPLHTRTANSWRSACIAIALFTILLTLPSFAQITPLGDSYTNGASPTKNYGSATTLGVDGASQITYIQFNLASIPSGASITQATLKLYVNSVTAAGSFNVDYVNSAWSEGTIDWNNAPSLGTTIASSVPVVTADKNQYLLINVTSALQAWLNGSETNNGIALVANGSTNLTFDSKENTTTSHPAEIDVVFTSGDGTITGVETPSGSGLQGGGTSGSLNLSLLTSCSSGQILEWSGSAWACTTVKGTGTVTSVGSGLGLTGGPITTSGTLSIDTTKLPLLASGNIFTNNNTFNVNSGAPILALNNTGTGDGIDLAAPGGTGVNVVGSQYGIQATGTIEGGVFTGTGTYGAGVVGLAPQASGFGLGVVGETYSSGPLAYGVEGVANASSGTPVGVYGYGYNPFSIGVWGQNGDESGTGGSFTGRVASGVWGDGGTDRNVGVIGTTDDSTAGYFINNSPDGYDTLLAEAESNQSDPFVAIDDATGAICYIDPNGNLNCSGSKNAVVPVDGGTRTVAMSAIESPKNWFEDFGSAQLTNGAAVVALDPEFTQTVNTSEEYQVFLTPYGDCKGLYVSNRTANSFEVHELGGGSASLSFGYRITALRRSYENVRFADHTHDLDSLKRMRERMHANHAQPRPHHPATKALPVRELEAAPLALHPTK